MLTNHARVRYVAPMRIFYGSTRRMDLSKARNELGYHPREPETALRQAFEYLQGSW